MATVRARHPRQHHEVAGGGLADTADALGPQIFYECRIILDRRRSTGPWSPVRRLSFTTVEDVVLDLGAGVLDVVLAPRGTKIQVSDVLIYDEQDPPCLASGALVLAVGMRPPEVAALLPELAEAGGILVIKVADQLPPHLVAEARRCEVTVLSVPTGASWGQIYVLMRAALAGRAGSDESSRLAGAAAGDLFALSDVVADLVGAPITIEDSQGQVVAYSRRQDETDEVRLATIVGRRTPGPWASLRRQLGIAQRLRRESGAIYFDYRPEIKPRLVIGVRVADELLGSIWAVVPDRPSRQRTAALEDAAKVVAVHMLRHRLETDSRRGIQNVLLSTVLDGGPLAAEAADRLGLAHQDFRVLAVAPQGQGVPDSEARLMRTWDLLSLHLSAVHRRAVTGLLRSGLYAVLPCTGTEGQDVRLARETARSFLDRSPAGLREGLLIGIGGRAAGVTELPRSRREADQVVRLLREQRDKLLADFDEMLGRALARQLGDVLTEKSITVGGALAILQAHDAEHQTNLVETLTAYLEAFGDARMAARRLGIHPNTLRYRLRRATEIAGLNLDDRDQRLDLLLQLRLFGSVASTGT